MKSVSSLQSMSKRIFGLAVVGTSWTLLVYSTRLQAEDRAAEFLEGLRLRNWHDVALEYLDQAEQDPLANPEFLERLDFERATTLARLAKDSASSKERLTLLQKAAAGFERFAKAQPESALGVSALSQAGKMRTEQAVQLLAKADRLPADAKAEREQLAAESRKLLQSASASTAEMLDRCEKQLAELPKAAALQADPDARARRQLLRSKQAEGKFLSANLEFETAQSYPEGSQQHQQALTKAAAAFSQIFQDYDGKRIGYFGRLYEGRCHQAAGKYEAALACYKDVIKQPSGDADYRRLVARAYRRRAECYLAADDFETVIEECQDWLNSSIGEERKQPEWLAVSFWLAKAFQIKAKQSDSASESRRLDSEARKLYREISKNPGDFQAEARVAMASTTSKKDSKPTDVKNFSEAFIAGKEALEQMNSSQLAMRLAAKNNPEAVEELQQQAAENRTAAQRYFEKAIAESDKKTAADELIEARYYLCWLMWEDQKYAEAAEQGETLAREHSENKFAPTSAKIALAAYERLYNIARKEGNQSDSNQHGEKLRSIAELIVQRWPNAEEATVAVNLLINLAIRDGRITDAENLLEQLPESARAAAELSLGGSLWNRYQQLLRAGNNNPSDEASKLKRRASELFTSGYQTLQSATSVSTAEATGLLYYVQLLLTDGKFAEALTVLEHPSIGPLTLARGNPSDGLSPEFTREVFKASLQAFASADPPRTDDAHHLMDELDQLTQGQPDAEQQLTNVYINLGLQLQRQLKELTTAGKKDKAAAVAASFADLLERVSGRSDVSDWKIRNWIAQTNLQLGEGLEGAEADRYLKNAEDAYRGIIVAVENDPSYAPSSQAVLGVRKRLGDCLSARHQYQAAYDQYTKILSEKSSILELQRATARVLQQWGTDNRDPEKLNQSIRGTMLQDNQKNLVWGWLQIAKVADYMRRKMAKSTEDQAAKQSTIEKYKEIYFSARYNAAKARFESALLAEGSARSKQIGTAIQSLNTFIQLYPQMGGTNWKPAFEKLMQEMQQAK